MFNVDLFCRRHRCGWEVEPRHLIMGSQQPLCCNFLLIEATNASLRPSCDLTLSTMSLVQFARDLILIVRALAHFGQLIILIQSNHHDRNQGATTRETNCCWQREQDMSNIITHTTQCLLMMSFSITRVAKIEKTMRGSQSRTEHIVHSPVR